MKTSKYEDTYVSVKKAEDSTKDVDAVAELLSTCGKAMSCKEIGFAIFGKNYNNWKAGIRYNGQSQHLGQILRHLREGNFIKAFEVDGEPVKVYEEKWVSDNGSEPRRIIVHDDAGNTYEIDNPKFDWRYALGHYETVEKTIVPKIKLYEWVA